MAIIYIGLGSNLAQPVVQLQTAVHTLIHQTECRFLQLSPFYRSVAIGPKQADYYNAAAKLSTDLNPYDTLAYLQTLESQQGRVRNVRWGERTLDLDLLSYDDVVMDDPQLTLPHPQIQFRHFVVFPLCDIAPDLELPGLGRVVQLKSALSSDGIWPWPHTPDSPHSPT